ncbi:4-hydroxythreonine-4-phosphate dehydrogenase PdxA [Limnochorda pilosa]|uniref:4-hydroxythreonine-4-phosphate dehydrogenase n=1 Tax=Limnochorda pilosa TaxID=1555112 RepID=A0A0K2SKX5_LIMPI|nr:4-hydroxythreonine-4-phosphate dehydrogenase PdxA [Limnochorda pilosa]BAS27750.1 4-hydroxythreonine-4-phosphate dehydrogenase [Limnochorda pilosa]
MDPRETRPVLAITAGDPAGIGPEITLAALGEPEVYRRCRPLVLAEPAVLERVKPLVAKDLRLKVVAGPAEARFKPGTVEVLPAHPVDTSDLERHVPFGRVSRLAGELAFASIRRSIDLALAGEVDGVVTGPIHKEAIKAAGVPFIGHTEMFQELTGSRTSLTMFRTGRLKIFFLTRHVSLRVACEMIRRDLLLETLREVRRNLEVLGVRDPEIGVAALNPHAGEGGLLGEEERQEMVPAIAAAQAEGIRAVGPVPADSIFVFAARGAYDAVLSLYHDQGHIASKVLDFERTISVTLGLPFVRSSVDHGTAFDIAGKGQAQHRSMVEAILAAAEYAPRIRAANAPAADRAGGA